MTQRELAELTGLSVSTIRRVEQSKKTTRRTLEKIAQALGVELFEIVHPSVREKYRKKRGTT